MNIEKQQQELIRLIKEELSLYDKGQLPSSYRHSVWFYPEYGRFLFDDSFIRYEVVEPLIQKGILIYKKFQEHQGEKMIRYVLSKEYEK